MNPTPIRWSGATAFKTQTNIDYLTRLYETHIQGKAGTGVDGISPTMFERELGTNLELISHKLHAGTYEFTRYGEKLISKGVNKSPRQISLPTVRDKLVLKYLAELLAKVFPEHVSTLPSVYVKKIKGLCEDYQDNFFLKIDIQNYYSSVDHEELLRMVKTKIKKKEVVDLITKAISTPTGKSIRPNKGIPQGLSISNILSSIYLSDIDKDFSKQTHSKYFRYVDDILMIGDISETRKWHSSFTRALTKRKKLNCHPMNTKGKTVISSVSSGVDYLGYSFQGNKARVRNDSQKKMIKDVIGYCTSLKHKPANKARTIWKLNLRISGCVYKGRKIGWIFYFSQTDGMEQLKELDACVAKFTKQVLTPEEQKKLNRFVKAHHEIRYKFDKSTYFPNFDNFSREQKIRSLKIILSSNRTHALDDKPDQHIDALFFKTISREVKETERDMFQAFS